MHKLIIHTLPTPKQLWLLLEHNKVPLPGARSVSLTLGRVQTSRTWSLSYLCHMAFIDRVSFYRWMLFLFVFFWMEAESRRNSRFWVCDLISFLCFNQVLFLVSVMFDEMPNLQCRLQRSRGLSVVIHAWRYGWIRFANSKDTCMHPETHYSEKINENSNSTKTETNKITLRQAKFAFSLKLYFVILNCFDDIQFHKELRN